MTRFSTFSAIVLVSCGLFASASMLPGMVGSAYGQTMSKKMFIAQLESTKEIRNSALFQLMKAELPKDYAAFFDMLYGGHKNRWSLKKTKQRSAEFTQAIRRRMAPNIKFAPDEDLKHALRSWLEASDVFKGIGGLKMCSTFAAKGGMGLLHLIDAKLMEKLNVQSASMFKASISGFKTPVKRNDPTQDDWQLVLQALEKPGYPENTAALIVDSKIDDPGFCDAIQAYYKELLEIPGAAGERLRANQVVSMAAG